LPANQTETKQAFQDVLIA